MMMLRAIALAAMVAAQVQAAECQRLYIGTHQQGGAPSLFTARFNDGSFGPATAVAALERPTWLVKDAALPVLYAVSETGNDGKSNGKVYSLRIGADGGLTEISQVESGGGGPTHLALDGRTLLVANYGTGHVATLGMDHHGALTGPISVAAGQGSGPTPRQRGPHAHGVSIDPSRQYVLVADLGADRIFIHRYDATRRQLMPASFVQLPAGSGPRHLVFGADGRQAYLLNELTGDLYVYAWSAANGTLQEQQKLSILSSGYTGKISAGEIIVSADGRQVYVSNRGDNSIIVYQTEPASGRLTELQRIPSGGLQPWHLVLSPDGKWLLASNEASNAVVAFRVGADGALAASTNQLEIPKPVNIIFVQQEHCS